MTKKHFIELADMIREHNQSGERLDASGGFFTPVQISAMADFCAAQNPNFKRDRWLDYIAGKCGKNGGAVKSTGNKLTQFSP